MVHLITSVMDYERKKSVRIGRSLSDAVARCYNSRAPVTASCWFTLFLSEMHTHPPITNILDIDHTCALNMHQFLSCFFFCSFVALHPTQQQWCWHDAVVLDDGFSKMTSRWWQCRDGKRWWHLSDDPKMMAREREMASLPTIVGKGSLRC